MSIYLLDTSTLIDFSKGHEPVRSRILTMIEHGEELGVCAINLAEFYAGLSPRDRPIWNQFFDTLTYWDITREAAARAGHDRYEFARQRRPLPAADVLIAAVARANDAVIITDNVTDYPMPGVRTLSLRS